MTENNKVDESSEQRPWWKLILSSLSIAISWMINFLSIPISWGLGAFIFGWLLAGVWYNRDYPNLTTIDKLGWADWGTASIAGLLFFVGSLSVSFRQKKRNKNISYLPRIFASILSPIFLVVALATLILTLTTYNGDWEDSRQGILTALGALIAAVGVVMTVSVNYRMGEENRLAQQKNLDDQLKHQRELENEKGEREQRKHDAELIKSLNDRLHDIIERRYSDDSQERSASYFQLAALYRDWEFLSDGSEIIKHQRDSQQRSILKILFGVYQKPTPKKQKRTQDEIQTLNSIIKDIFPHCIEYATKEGWPGTSEDPVQIKFDLSFLNLCGLDFSYRDLRSVKLFNAHLERSNLMGADLRGVNLRGAYLIDDVDFTDLHLQDADLAGAHLQGAHLEDVCLQGANLQGANLRGANLIGANLQGANLRRADLASSVLWLAKFEESELAETRFGSRMPAEFFDDFIYSAGSGGSLGVIVSPEEELRVINQLKVAKSLPGNISNMGEPFNKDFVKKLRKSHEEYWMWRKFFFKVVQINFEFNDLPSSRIPR